MALTAGQRTQVRDALMETGLFPSSNLKSDLGDAIAGQDDTLDTLAVQINLGFTNPYRSTATVAEKDFMLALIMIRRAIADGIPFESIRRALARAVN